MGVPPELTQSKNIIKSNRYKYINQINMIYAIDFIHIFIHMLIINARHRRHWRW